MQPRGALQLHRELVGIRNEDAQGGESREGRDRGEEVEHAESRAEIRTGEHEDQRVREEPGARQGGLQAAEGQQEAETGDRRAAGGDDEQRRGANDDEQQQQQQQQQQLEEQEHGESYCVEGENDDDDNQETRTLSAHQRRQRRAHATLLARPETLLADVEPQPRRVQVRQEQQPLYQRQTPVVSGA